MKLFEKLRNLDREFLDLCPEIEEAAKVLEQLDRMSPMDRNEAFHWHAQYTRLEQEMTRMKREMERREREIERLKQNLADCYAGNDHGF